MPASGETNREPAVVIKPSRGRSRVRPLPLDPLQYCCIALSLRVRFLLHFGFHCPSLPHDMTGRLRFRHTQLFLLLDDDAASSSLANDRHAASLLLLYAFEKLNRVLPLRTQMNPVETFFLACTRCRLSGAFKALTLDPLGAELQQ